MENLKHFGSCNNNENISSEPTSLRILGVDRNVYGFPYDERNKEYTVLLVGATKCGKSTIIDSIANFFMGINSPKNGVIHITRSNTEKEEFCFYTFCTNDNKIFTFIDSPSINNKSGFIDKNRKKHFLTYIDDLKEKGITVNALGFVIQNHFVRLPPAEESMLKFVSGLLKEESISHIIPFITYADANKPPVIDALRTFGIHTDNCLVFNNVNLNFSMKRITNLSEMYWENVLEDIQKGLDVVMKLQPIDLIGLTQENIEIKNIKEPVIDNTQESIEGSEFQREMKNLKHMGSCKIEGNISSKPTRLDIFGNNRNVFGYPYDVKHKEYTVLLVGTRKSGKSTIIDFMANFFMGISTPKNGVIHITRNDINKETFYFYTFCSSDNTVFTFIDSPSINNESGFIDKKRKQKFLKCIKEMKQNNIKINALGFVIQNHFVRLGHAEGNMLTLVTELLQEDNNVHIIPFITYADANTPPVLKALHRFGIGKDNFLVFNNVCLDSSIRKITELNEMYWENGLENIQKGLDFISKLEPINLVDIVPQEDTETNNEEPIIEETIDGRRSSRKSRKTPKNPSNTFSGRRSSSSPKKDSRSIFSSMRSGSMRKKKQREYKEDIPEVGTQTNSQSQRADPSDSKKRSKKRGNECTIL